MILIQGVEKYFSKRPMQFRTKHGWLEILTSRNERKVCLKPVV